MNSILPEVQIRQVVNQKRWNEFALLVLLFKRTNSKEGGGEEIFRILIE